MFRTTIGEIYSDVYSGEGIPQFIGVVYVGDAVIEYEAISETKARFIERNSNGEIKVFCTLEGSAYCEDIDNFKDFTLSATVYASDLSEVIVKELRERKIKYSYEYFQPQKTNIDFSVQQIPETNFYGFSVNESNLPTFNLNNYIGVQLKYMDEAVWANYILFVKREAGLTSEDILMDLVELKNYCESIVIENNLTDTEELDLILSKYKREFIKYPINTLFFS